MKVESPVLYLVLKKKWFDLIEQGIKKEEYREIKKHWFTRLFYSHCEIEPQILDEILKDMQSFRTDKSRHRSIYSLEEHFLIRRKYLHIVEFRLGYAKNCKSMQFYIDEIDIKRPLPEWSSGEIEPKNCFAIVLGKRLK